MAFPIPTKISPHTTVEVEDSCNCCIPKKKKPPLQRQDAVNDLFIKEITMPVPPKDFNEVYNLNINITNESPHHHKNSHGSRKHSDASDKTKK